MRYDIRDTVVPIPAFRYDQRMSKTPRIRRGRKLLVASVGVATLSFAGCGEIFGSSGNLMSPPSCRYDNTCDSGEALEDAGPVDAGPADAGQTDAGESDAGESDGGEQESTPDAGE